MKYEEIVEQSKAAQNQWGKQWLHNSTENGKLYKKNGTTQKDVLNHGIGRTLVCAAMGQSLEESIDVMKEHRANFDLACVDKAFGPLMDHGIKPDFVVIADANVSWADWGERHADATDDITLIANVNCALEWTMNWKGRIIFYVNKDNIETEKIYSKTSGCTELIPASSNVGNTVVVFFAQICKYDQYLLIGYDYSWAPQSNYYAFTDSDKRHWMRHVHMLGIDGELCYTSTNLHFSARWLIEYCQKQIPGVRVVNCSGKGVIAIQPGNLKTLLSCAKTRKWTADEVNFFFNSRIETVGVQYQGPEKLVEILKKFKYVAGIKLDVLKNDISPSPQEFAA